MKIGVERSLILGLLANWAFTEKEKRRPRWWLRLVTYTRYPHGLFYSAADVVVRGCCALWPKMLRNMYFKLSIITVFCNSHKSILTLHSIHSTSNLSLYCGYEHWLCSLSYRLQEDQWLFSDYQLLENEENLEYERHIWTPWGALWALEKHPCWHLCALHWWVDLKYT